MSERSYEDVAQVSNLLYRRLPVGRLSPPRRARGLEIRDTAGWKPALRFTFHVSFFTPHASTHGH